jgi:hypothetical protein
VESGRALGQSDERKIFQQFLGQYGGPAFVRRARDVQLAFESLVEACRCQREEWLAHVRLPLGTLVALAGSWSALLPILENSERAALLQALHAELAPRLRLPVAPTTSVRRLRRALAELHKAIERFNQRWLDFLHKLDLRKVNSLRDGYNRFYLMEKECALGSARVARQGFQRLEPLTADEIMKMFPVLPLP